MKSGLVARPDAATHDPSSDVRDPHRAWSDERLVRACLAGNEAAWSALIDKYKTLIYAIPRRYGASPEDASDIFQAVCLELFSELLADGLPARYAPASSARFARSTTRSATRCSISCVSYRGVATMC